MRTSGSPATAGACPPVSTGAWAEASSAGRPEGATAPAAVTGGEVGAGADVVGEDEVLDAGTVVVVVVVEVVDVVDVVVVPGVPSGGPRGTVTVWPRYS